MMKDGNIYILRRLFRYLRPYRLRYITGAGMLALAGGAFQILLAFALRGLIDAAVIGDIRQLLQILLLCGLALMVIIALFPWFNRMMAKSLQAATLDMGQELFDHLQELPVAYHEQRHSNDIITRLTNDIPAAGNVFGGHMIQLLTQVVAALASAVFLYFISWKLLVLALVVGVLPLIYNYFAAKPLQDMGRKAQQDLAGLNSRLKDLLTGMPIIRSFNLEKQFSGIYRSANAENLATRLRRNRLQAVVNTVTNIMGAGNAMAIFAYSAFLLIRGELTAGDTIAAVQVSQGIISFFGSFGRVWAAMQASLASGTRIFEVLDEPAELNEAIAQESPGCIDSAVAFREVSFAYGERQVLSNITFDVPYGGIVAFAGPSGGGKSTIFKLILGFHRASAGRICVGNRDIACYSLEELRGMVSYVPQDSYLYTGTIYENIACAKQGASREEVETAARHANAHNFIINLPEGYHTQAGERGVQLSAGQRQRIAIARALLRDSPILLLDEATSSLDSEAERLVQEALERLMAGRTTIVIAHRLSTIRTAGRIYFITDGQVAESGSHEELLALGGAFRHYYDMQAREAS